LLRTILLAMKLRTVHALIPPMIAQRKIAVIIPCFKCREHILEVLSKIPSFVDKVYIVDDACPQQTGNWAKENSKDIRFEFIFHTENRGVGAATMTGYKKALADGIDICVKIDGDDQMDQSLMELLIRPLLKKNADYSKGNRFYYPYTLVHMPIVRLLGNSALSFMAKVSSGYYNIFDPTNGYTAIHRQALSLIEMEKLSNRFFFETDLLYRLNIIKAVVVDVPMKPIYKDEKSNLNSFSAIPKFFVGHMVNFVKRLTYSYFLRGFSIASICFIAMSAMITFGAIWSAYHWHLSYLTGTPTTSGTVMIGVLALILGMQFLIHFFIFDIAETPSVPLQKVFDEDNEI
jgi:dolichol-phosphate mannosyltransferase